MKYKNLTEFSHNQADRIGVIISNLGTPEAPTAKALRPYLKQFLSDPRVVEVPRFLWWLILNGIILRFRPGRSAKAYKKVWSKQGSPLAVYTAEQAKALTRRLKESMGELVEVAWAMRYGQPSVGKAIESLQAQGVRKLLVLPLYPQYSATTTASTFDALAEDFQQRRWIPELRFVTSYHDSQEYILAVAESIRRFWQDHEKAEKLVFSYHGIPLRYLHNGDPYHCQCLKTSRLIAEELGIGEQEYLICFQSRFGREPWLKPYLDHTLKELPVAGVKSVQVVCPGFSADCLETLEEVGMENRAYFMEAGGERYDYIPALNADSAHIEMLEKIVLRNISGWEFEEKDILNREACWESFKYNRK